MVVAAVLFALAAVLGVVLATRVARQQPRPLGMALAHGAFAAAGLIALVVVVVGDAPALALWALAGFAVAAVGGFFLFGLDRTGRDLPLPVVAVHGLVAVSAFLVLLAAVAGMG
jgi:hypothetical protein